MWRLVDTFDGMCMVLDAGSGIELWRQLEYKQIDLLLVGIHQSDQDELDTAGQLRAQYPGIKILVVSDLDERETKRRAGHNDLHGFLYPDCDVDGLETAIRQLCDPGNDSYDSGGSS